MIWLLFTWEVFKSSNSPSSSLVMPASLNMAMASGQCTMQGLSVNFTGSLKYWSRTYEQRDATHILGHDTWKRCCYCCCVYVCASTKIRECLYITAASSVLNLASKPSNMYLNILWVTSSTYPIHTHDIFGKGIDIFFALTLKITMMHHTSPIHVCTHTPHRSVRQFPFLNLDL
jgi:hypothetical protein